MDIFIFASDIRSNTQFGRRTARADQLLRQFIIAVRRFDEQLRLVLLINAPCQLLDRIRTL